jgi:hypothetical protein
MKKTLNNTLTPLAITMLLIASIAVVLYTPTIGASPGPQHVASVSPTVTIVPEVKYVFNVTCKSESINKTNIIFPEEFEYVSAQAPTGWNAAKNWPYVNFTGSNLATGSWLLFNVSVKWPAVPPTTAKFGVDTFNQTTPSMNNTVWLTVSFNPKFSATIDKTHVKGSTSYLFNITTVNVASDIGLGTINITYPSGWTFNALKGYGGSRTWSAVHNSATNTFKLTGPNLLVGEYVWIQVNMTTPSTTREHDHWNSTAWDISGTWLGTYVLPVIVDAESPIVTINKPDTDYYTVGSGNRIWINATVTDDLNITKYGMTVTINDTARFEFVKSEKQTDFAYKYYYGNKTAIPDGPLAVKITATDKAGNVRSAENSTTVDNTAPRIVWVKVLDKSNAPLPYVGGVYWMGSATDKIKVNASFYNPAKPINGKIYLNTTEYTFANETATDPLDVTGSDYVTLKITLVDSARPTPNNFTQTWEIKRDKVKPSAPTFTVQPICGGAIIRALNATDNVGVLKYRVYINGTPVDVSLANLNELTLTTVDGHSTFAGILLLNLTDYAGKVANITIATVDYGANEGPANTAYSSTSIPEGQWYPIELYKGWNLISLPLIPANSSRAAILSLILKQGATGVTVIYEYDQYLDSWIVNPTTMTDGKGYWVYMKADDLMIVSGTVMPPPGGMPPTYTLTKGWVLAGFKSVQEMNVTYYLASVREANYFRILYVWNAEDQSWGILDRENPAAKFVPGQGFWIYMYEEEVLIPPLP